MSNSDADIAINVTGNGLEEAAAGLDSLAGSADTTQASFDGLAQTTVDPQVDASALDDLTSSAGDAETELETVSGTDVAPTSDTSGLDEISSSAGDAQTAVDDVAATPVVVDVDTSGLDGVAGAAGDAGGAIDDVGETSVPNMDRAMRGMTSKALQDIPGMKGAFGDMAPVLGRLGGMMATNTDAIAGMIGPMLGFVAAALLIKGIIGLFHDNAAEEKENAEQVKTWTKALEGGKPAAEAFVDALKQAGEIKFTFLDKTADLTPILADAGVTADQFTTAIMGGKTGLDGLQSSMKAAGVSGGDMNLIMVAAAQQQINYGKATKQAQAFTDVFGDSVGDAAKAALTQKDATDQAKQAVTDIQQALDDTTDSYKRQAAEIDATLKSQQALVAANRDAADANYAVLDANDAFNEGLADLDQTVKDANGDQTKIAAAYRANVQNAADLADATSRAKQAQDTANGVTETAAQKQDTWNQSMLTSAATAKGAQRDAILAYIATANGIPTAIATQITAAVNAGDLDTANQLLAGASKDRATAIKVDVDQASLDSVTAKLNALTQGKVADIGVSLGAGLKAHARGGITEGGPILVGEEGAEILGDVPAGVPVHTAAETAAMRRAGLGQAAATTIHYHNETLHMHMPVGLDPNAVVASIRRWIRSNGAI